MINKAKKILVVPFFPIWFFPLVLFAPILRGKAIFWGTPALQFHPWHVITINALSKGQLPLWTNLVGMGAPIVANYQSSVFYPPNWIIFFVGVVGGEAWMAWAQGLLLVFHLILAGFGMVTLLRDLGFGKLSQVISGLAFGMSSYLVSRAGFLSINAAVAWLPWVLWGSVRLISNQKLFRGNFWKDFKKLGVIIGFQLLAGHAQITWYTMILAGLWVCFWGWHRVWEGSIWEEQNIYRHFSEKLKSMLSSLFAFMGATLTGAGLASIQLIPTAEFLYYSHRGNGADYDFVMNYSFWPWRLLTLVFPNFFGTPSEGNYWGFGNYWEDAIYVGLLTIILFVFLLFQFRYGQKVSKLVRSFVLFSLLMLIVTFVLAMGRNTFVFPWLYRNVPTFTMFQAPTRYTIWSTLFLSILGGIGAFYWKAPQGKKVKKWLYRALVVALSVSLSSAAAGYFLPFIKTTFVRASVWAGLLGIGISLLAIFYPGSNEKQKFGRWIWLISILMGLDMVIAGWGLNPFLDISFYNKPAANHDKVGILLDKGRLYIPLPVEQELKFKRYFQFDTFEGNWGTLRESYLPNLNILDGFPSVNNFDPLLLSRYAKWMRALENVDPTEKRNMLNFMGVSVVEELDYLEGNSLTFKKVDGAALVRWIPCAQIADREEVSWLWVQKKSFSVEGPIAIETDTDKDIAPICTNSGYEEVDYIWDNNNQVRINVSSLSNGWLVLATTWMPGWTAEVDGLMVPVYRGDYLFQAVPIKNGQQEVVLSYRPVSIRIGFILTAISGLFLVVPTRKLMRKKKLT